MKFFLKYGLSIQLLINIIICHRCHAQRIISLTEALNLAKYNNLQVKQAQLNESYAKLDLYKSKQAIFPNLSFNNNGNVYFGRTLDPSTNLFIAENSFTMSGNLTSSIILFSGLQKLNQIKQNKISLEASTTNIEKERYDVEIQVIATYLQLLNFQDQIKALKAQLELANQEYDLEEKKLEVGKKTQADISRSQYQISKVAVQLNNAENELKRNDVTFEQLLNLDPSLKYNIVAPKIVTVDTSQLTRTLVYNYTMSHSPQIRYAELLRQSTLKALAVSKGSLLPVLSFNGTISSNYLYQFHFSPNPFSSSQFQTPFSKQIGNNLYEYFSLSLSIPIYNNHLGRVAIRKAKLDVESADLNVELEKSKLYKFLNDAWSDLDAAKKNLKAAESAYNASKATFDIVNKKYEVGSADSFTFRQAQTDMNQSEISLIFEKYDVLFKQYVILFYFGHPDLE